MEHSSLVHIHGGRLVSMHNDLVESGANLCIECAGCITFPRGESTVSKTYCQICYARTCFNTYCRQKHRDRFHPPRRMT